MKHPVDLHVGQRVHQPDQRISALGYFRSHGCAGDFFL